MASLRIIFVALAILGITISETYATDHIVGDEKGWTLHFDYLTWASQKQFLVGDRIIFKYPVGHHNVVKVDKSGFQQCNAPAYSAALLTGYDVIELKTPGVKWYICSVGQHCKVGKMKIAIKVWDKISEAPAPAPTSGGSWY